MNEIEQSLTEMWGGMGKRVPPGFVSSVQRLADEHQVGPVYIVTAVDQLTEANPEEPPRAIEIIRRAHALARVERRETSDVCSCHEGFVEIWRYCGIALPERIQECQTKCACRGGKWGPYPVRYVADDVQWWRRFCIASDARFFPPPKGENESSRDYHGRVYSDAEKWLTAIYQAISARWGDGDWDRLLGEMARRGYMPNVLTADAA